MPTEQQHDYPSCFNRLLKDILKKFIKSKQTILVLLASLSLRPSGGDRIPGFAPFDLRKVRFGLPEYRIGKSGGLRVIYMVHPSRVIPLFISIYFKGDYRSEHDVVALVKSNLKEILETL